MIDLRALRKKLQIFLLCFIIVLTTFCLAVRLKPDIQRRMGVFSTQGKAVSRVIIDAGHGSPDGGASTSDGVLEKDLNLAVALRLRDFLAFGGFETIMTREGDEAIYDEGSNSIRQKKRTDLNNRVKILRQNPDAPLVSIHMNTFPQPKYSGAQVFYSPNEKNSKLLADYLQNGVSTLLSPDNKRVAKQATIDIFLLKQARQTAVLVECGFLSNPEEAALLCSEGYQAKMAFALFASYLEGYEAIERAAGEQVN